VGAVELRTGLLYMILGAGWVRWHEHQLQALEDVHPVPASLPQAPTLHTALTMQAHMFTKGVRTAPDSSANLNKSTSPVLTSA
jgi:hypothetical protein